MRIDCDECVMQHTTACDDCVVSFIVERPRQSAVVLDLEEERAVRRLEEAGLVPGLLYLERSG